MKSFKNNNNLIKTIIVIIGFCKKKINMIFIAISFFFLCTFVIDAKIIVTSNRKVTIIKDE